MLNTYCSLIILYIIKKQSLNIFAFLLLYLLNGIHILISLHLLLISLHFYKKSFQLRPQ